jgi:hypothetical protein
MKRFSVSILAAVVGLALAGPRLVAQPPINNVSAYGSAYGTAPPPAPVVLPPMTGAAYCAPTCKVCVSEPRPVTKWVYSTKCEEYCLPHCSLLAILRGECGCEDGSCGEVRTKHRLVMKKVECFDGKRCVLKDMPTACAPVCAPTTAATVVVPGR